MVYKAKEIVLEHLARVIIKKSEDEHIHLNNVAYVDDIEIGCTEGKLSICGIPTSHKSNSSVAGVTIKRSLSGGISVNNVSGKNISIINDQVWIEGKQVDQKDIPPPPPPITILLPDNLICMIKDCEDVEMQDHQFSYLYLDVDKQNTLCAGEITCKDDIRLLCSGRSKINVDKVSCAYSFTVQTSGQSNCKVKSVQCKPAKIITSGQSEVKIDGCIARVIDIQVSGTGEVKIKHADIEKAQFVTSGQATCKVEGLLTEVIASTSGMSTCKFSTPRNQPFITKKGLSTCKTIE